MSYWHQTCTAKMDQDAMSAVDGTLLKIIWNTKPSHRRRIDHALRNNRQHLAPCVIIGERAAEILKSHVHNLTSPGKK
jgi:choline dehydrogenase